MSLVSGRAEVTRGDQSCSSTFTHMRAHEAEMLLVGLVERKTEWLADLLVEDGLWVSWASRAGDDEGWRGEGGEQGLALALVSAPSGVEGMERLGVEETGWTPLFFGGKAGGSDMSLESGMGSGRQGKGMNHMGPLLTSRVLQPEG